jgi:TPR repeat protein
MSKFWLRPLIAVSALAGLLSQAPQALAAADETAIKELVLKIAKNDADALKQLQNLADKGDMVAQDRLGLVYLAGQGVPVDYAQAQKWLFASAVQHYAQAESHIAYMYGAGIGTDKDEKSAIEWYQRACDHNNFDSCFNLALTFDKGSDDVKKDPQRAEALYRKAAEGGVAVAQFDLGSLYFGTDGHKRDLAEAYRWMSKAADAGNGSAMYVLGERYKHGYDTPVDNAKALDWYKKAVAAGNWISAGVISEAYKSGTMGLEKDKDKSDEWYKKFIDLQMKKNQH